MTTTLRWMAIGAVLLAPGCASHRVPEAELGKAELAIRDAEQARAEQHAPLELRLAREKYDRAREAVDDDRNLRARRLAEEALVDAELAETKAQAEEAQRTASGAHRTIRTLEEESTRGLETEPLPAE